MTFSKDAFLLLLLVVSTLGEPRAGGGPAAASKYEPGYLYVKLRRAESSMEAVVAAVDRMRKDHPDLASIAAVQPVFVARPGFKDYLAKRRIGLDRWIRLTVPSHLDVGDEAKKWAALPEVEMAEPQPIYEPTAVPNDPNFGSQWHHDNTGSNPGVTPGTPDSDIDAVEAWDLETGSTLVGDPDQGIEWFHDDLVGNIWQNLAEDADGDGSVLEWNGSLGRHVFDSGDSDGLDGTAANGHQDNGYIDDFVGWDFLTNDNDPQPSSPSYFHGTLTAGALLAEGNNGIGVSGVCWDCRLIATRSAFTGPEVEYLVDNGARVISISLLGTLSGVMEDAFEYASSQGVILAIAAGNNASSTTNGLCTFEDAVCVSATDQSDRLANFSNYGSRVDVGSPGVQIWTTNLNDGYTAIGGTSMATPVAAGTAALMLSMNPTMTIDEVLSVLQSSTDPFVLPGQYAGEGRINAHRALLDTQAAMTWGSTPLALIDVAATQQVGSSLSIQGIAAGAGAVYELMYGVGAYPSVWTSIAQYQQPAQGELHSWDLLPIPKGNYRVRLSVTDLQGRTATDGLVMTRGTLYQSGSWPAQTAGPVKASPAVADLDGDGDLEVVFGSQNSEYLYALNHDGSIQWQFRNSSNTLTFSVSVGDLDGLGGLDVIAGDNHILALDGNGNQLWKVPGLRTTTGTPALGNMVGDDCLEVVLVGEQRVWSLDKEGALLWEYLPPGSSHREVISPVLCNLDQDEYLEIVVGSENRTTFALDGNGTLLWTYPEWTETPPAAGDLDDDGDLEIVVASRCDGIHVLNQDGSLFWHYPLNCTSHYPVLGDINADGQLDIVFRKDGDNRGIHALDGSGSPLWEYTGFFSLSPPALGDVDGDGKLDVVFSSWDSSGNPKLYALHGDNGLLIEHWPLTPGGYVNSPAIADIDEDGNVEVLVGSDDGKLHAWMTEQPSTETPGWCMEGYDLHRTRTIPPEVTLSAPQNRAGKLALTFTNPLLVGGEVSFALPDAGHARLEVFDINGRRVTVLFDGLGQGGENRTTWSGKDARGQAISGGVYFIRLVTAERTLSRRCLVI